MKILNSSPWHLSPHCWDHVLEDAVRVQDQYSDSVLFMANRTYWPLSMIEALEEIIHEAVQKVEEEGSWVQTVRAQHQSLVWKLFTHRDIELHLSVTQDEKGDFWVHAYPTRHQHQSGRHVHQL